MVDVDSTLRIIMIIVIKEHHNSGGEHAMDAGPNYNMILIIQSWDHLRKAYLGGNLSIYMSSLSLASNLGGKHKVKEE